MIPVLLAGLVLSVPHGFYEAKRLEPAAAYVSRAAVTVACSRTMLDWRDYLREWAVPYGASPNATAVTTFINGRYSIMINQQFCQQLLIRIKKKRNAVATKAFTDALLTLTHESVHARGIRDEGQVECAAIRLMPAVAVRYFGFSFKYRRPLRALMADAWKAHRAKPAEYQSVC